MKGQIEGILTQRYGAPSVLDSTPFVQYRWEDADVAGVSTLYKAMDWDANLDDRLLALEMLYGDAVGGSLVGDSLKIAMLLEPEVYGLCSIQELWSQEEVRKANDLDDEVLFFMDASNVWFYGIKGGYLYAFDAETEELDRLGPAAQEVGNLIAEWEDANRDNAS